MCDEAIRLEEHGLRRTARHVVIVAERVPLRQRNRRRLRERGLDQRPLACVADPVFLEPEFPEPYWFLELAVAAEDIAHDLRTAQDLPVSAGAVLRGDVERRATAR